MKRINFPLVGVIISAVALTFQVTALYPWHHKISKDVQDLRHLLESYDLESLKKLEKPSNAQK